MFGGKSSRLAFKSNLHMRVKEELCVVHSYICRPLKVPIYGGNKYLITFVDEFSRMLWLLLIKAKSEALQIFKDFKAMMERQSGKMTNILRPYGGGEYN